MAAELPACPAGHTECKPSRTAVLDAEKAVAEAHARQALWITARDALERSRKAFASGDYAGAANAARFAREQARMGIEQSGYPKFPVPQP